MKTPMLKIVKTLKQYRPPVSAQATNHLHLGFSASSVFSRFNRSGGACIGPNSLLGTGHILSP
jgi:hypothetical protein